MPVLRRALPFVFIAETFLMNHSPLTITQLNEVLRSYALTVEEASPGEFKWRILENHGPQSAFESVRCSDMTFAAYDTALATQRSPLALCAAQRRC